MRHIVIEGRRAVLRSVALLGAAISQPRSVLPPPAHAASERVTAQSVGVTQPGVGVLSDPRALADGEGLKPLIWGGRERCDPTDPRCTQGGEMSGDAASAQPVPDRGASVTDRVRLDMSIGGEKVGSVEIGLFRDCAPQAVDTFVKLSAGRLVSAADEQPASLERSVAVRVLKDKAVVLGGLKVLGGSIMLVPGRTKPQRVAVAPPLTTDDTTNGGPHDAAGLLSVKRGGGSFEFTLTPRPSPTLDRDNIVIGKIINSDGMAILERINSLPTDNYQQRPLATVKVERAVVI